MTCVVNLAWYVAADLGVQSETSLSRGKANPAN